MACQGQGLWQGAALTLTMLLVQCRLIGEDVWPVTHSLSRSLWQVGNKICRTLRVQCNLTVTTTPEGTVQELGLPEKAHPEGKLLLKVWSSVGEPASS